MCQTNKTNKGKEESKSSKVEEVSRTIVWTSQSSEVEEEVEVEIDSEEELTPLYAKMDQTIITIENDED